MQKLLKKRKHSLFRILPLRFLRKVKKMSQTQHQLNGTSQELDLLIDKAIKKISGNKENDICKYLPSSSGGYIHHFTMRKMKHERPKELSQMIEKFIVDTSKPQTVPPKSRAARGSKKRLGQYAFSREELDRMRQIALAAGDKDLARKLTPKKDPRHIKKELISSIKKGSVDQELWFSYVESTSQQPAPHNS